MSDGGSGDRLARVAAAREPEVSAPRADGSWTPWTPIWVVRVDGVAHARTWRARTTGWYGRAVRSGRAWLRVPGVEVEVVVRRVDDPALEDRVSEVYRAKYGGGASSMVTAEATATTLALHPVDGSPT
ncbi:DUF2255 family protein [Phycicoccus sonneratiae]|uniref:DUF2255 family protein n=1 Tax=Phycicoccus sonneratiae TaxID=2807628 RepID=A0ABS2CG14_9MICO|nr:DUF2255 family protein [Phycicoccus sonneraticus]MBM6398811.1 DUF2255 family protein [Phycicoccus sonneraticus]